MNAENNVWSNILHFSVTRLAKRLILKMLFQHEGALSGELGSERRGGSEALKDAGSPLFYVRPEAACVDLVVS